MLAFTVLVVATAWADAAFGRTCNGNADCAYYHLGVCASFAADGGTPRCVCPLDQWADDAFEACVSRPATRFALSVPSGIALLYATPTSSVVGSVVPPATWPMEWSCDRVSCHASEGRAIYYTRSMATVFLEWLVSTELAIRASTPTSTTVNLTQWTTAAALGPVPVAFNSGATLRRLTTSTLASWNSGLPLTLVASPLVNVTAFVLPMSEVDVLCTGNTRYMRISASRAASASTGQERAESHCATCEEWCGPQGLCTDATAFTCRCAVGWTGARCEQSTASALLDTSGRLAVAKLPSAFVTRPHSAADTFATIHASAFPGYTLGRPCTVVNNEL